MLHLNLQVVYLDDAIIADSLGSLWSDRGLVRMETERDTIYSQGELGGLLVETHLKFPFELFMLQSHREQRGIVKALAFSYGSILRASCHCERLCLMNIISLYCYLLVAKHYYPC